MRLASLREKNGRMRRELELLQHQMDNKICILRSNVNPMEFLNHPPRNTVVRFFKAKRCCQTLIATTDILTPFYGISCFLDLEAKRNGKISTLRIRAESF
jgi:hypothetical protein